MKSIYKALGLISMLTIGISGAQAADTTWDFRNSNRDIVNTAPGYYGNSLTMNQDGVNLAISAWSDTYDISGPDKVESAYVTNNSYGLLAYNRNGGYSEQHYIDNYKDTDMLLFSFSDAVSLTSLKLGSYYNDSDISIAAFDSLPSLSGSTWAGVASQAIFSTSFTDVGYGSFDLTSVAKEAKYWIIGAYKNVFGAGNDHDYDKFKLLALTTHKSDEEPPVDVPAPATALLMLLSLGLLTMRKRHK